MKGHGGIESVPVTEDEAIENNRTVTGCGKLADTVAADVTGSSYDENIHALKLGEGGLLWKAY